MIYSSLRAPCERLLSGGNRGKGLLRKGPDNVWVLPCGSLEDTLWVTHEFAAGKLWLCKRCRGELDLMSEYHNLVYPS